MENLNYFSLDLRKKLQYIKADIQPFTFPGNAEEVLMFFELDEVQGKSFEPDPEKLLGILQWTAIMAKEERSGTDIELPLGKYFMSQVREILDKDGSTALAIEVQKEGLWERKKLGNKMYLRYLYEHGSPVTQVFRELLEDSE